MITTISLRQRQGNQASNTDQPTEAPTENWSRTACTAQCSASEELQKAHWCTHLRLHSLRQRCVRRTMLRLNSRTLPPAIKPRVHSRPKMTEIRPNMGSFNRRRPRSCGGTAPDTMAWSRRDGERKPAANCPSCGNHISLRQPEREGWYPRFDAWPRRGGFAPHTHAASLEAHRQTSDESCARSSRRWPRAS